MGFIQTEGQGDNRIARESAEEPRWKREAEVLARVHESPGKVVVFHPLKREETG